jgi:hypothetical protein
LPATVAQRIEAQIREEKKLADVIAKQTCSGFRRDLARAFSKPRFRQHAVDLSR